MDAMSVAGGVATSGASAAGREVAALSARASAFGADLLAALAGLAVEVFAVFAFFAGAAFFAGFAVFFAAGFFFAAVADLPFAAPFALFDAFARFPTGFFAVFERFAVFALAIGRRAYTAPVPKSSDLSDIRNREIFRG